MPLNEPEFEDIYRAMCHPDMGELSVGRRRFLQGSIALGGAMALGPTVFADEASALGADDRILVCIYLGGGNDGLNMIAPLDDGAYFDARQGLAINASSAHHIAPNRYLHPSLPLLADRFRNGEVAIVEGVGHRDDDHSHFNGVATWMAASTARGPNTSGWLGRYLDDAGLGQLGAINVGDSGVPLHLRGRHKGATGLPTNGNLFGADVEERWEAELLRVFADLKSADFQSGEMAQAWASELGSAIDVASEISPIYENNPDERGLSRNLTLAAKLINLNLGTRIVGTASSQYDTHDDQAPQHAMNLAELDDAIAAFYSTLRPKFRNRVVIMTFSEFGRRVKANDSRGTDHGTAGPMLMIGPAVKAGFHGTAPSIRKLDERGDLKHTVDFRDVYASVLSQWLKADDTQILGGSFDKLDLLGSPASAGATNGGGGLTREGVVPGQRLPRNQDVPTTGDRAKYSELPGSAFSSDLSDVVKAF